MRVYFPVSAHLVFYLLLVIGADAQEQSDADNSGTSQLVERLVAEMEDLIPGSYAKDSEEQKKLVDAAEFFVARDEEKTRGALTELTELAAMDSRLPPQNLLLAGLSYATNNPQMGKSLLERAGIEHRNHPSVALAFARLALVQGRFFDAMSLVERAQAQAQASEFDAESQKFYALETINTMTVIETRRNELERAEKFAREWERLSPASNEMLLASAELGFRQDRIESAVEYLNRRSKERLNDLPTELIIAKWFRAKNDLANHSKWVQAAYEKYSTNAATQLEYAAWLLRNSKFEQVESIVSDFESVNGESVDSLSIKGRIAFSSKNYAKAESIFGNLHQQQPNNFEHSLLYMLSLMESGESQKLQQALAIGQRNFQTYPNSQLAVASMGWGLLKSGNSEVGKQLLVRASKLGNTLPDTAYFLATMLYQDSRQDEALKILNQYEGLQEMFLYRERATELSKLISSEQELPLPEDK